MRVLMLESHPGVAAAAVAELTRAGHVVERCTTADRRVPCRALAGAGDCPLDAPVDVAVVAQEQGVDRVEHGAVCSARSRVPVLDIGPQRASPWISVHAPDLLAACARAARDGRAHERAVARELAARGVVAMDELTGPRPAVAFFVERGAGRLRMTIALADDARHREAELLRAAAQALRDYDRQASVIDVVVRALAEPV